MSDEDIALCVEALWDYQDARWADFKYESDFDKATAELGATFRAYLEGYELKL